MGNLKWNLCTSFAAMGAAIAYCILFLFFGFHWVLLPGALLGLGAAYLVSTKLGVVLTNIHAGRKPIPALVLGASCALLTLIAGAFGIGFGNFIAETVREVYRAPAGQPLWNRLSEFAPVNAFDFIFQPVLVGTLFGAIPALALGLIFGAVLHARTESSGSPEPNVRAWTFGAAGLIVGALAVLWFSMTGSLTRTADRYAALPMAIGECGQTAIGAGVLAYCRGFPCDAGECDFGLAQDAFAIYAEPPPGAGWSWAGGGLGTTKRADEIGHQMYWVQRSPDGFIDANSPRRHQSYKLRFDGQQIVVGDRKFGFTPGMLLVVTFNQDWSYSVLQGPGALQEAGIGITTLQRALEEACANVSGCDRAFQLRVPKN